LADRKRGSLLSYQGYLFARNRTRSNKIYWRCVDMSCAVFIHTPAFVAILGATSNGMREPSGHCHPPSDSSIQRREMVQEMLNIVHADPCAPIRSAYDQATAGRAAAHRPFADEAVPIFSSLETILRRRRSEAFPPTSITIDDVEIKGEWAVTWIDRQHLSLLDNQWGIAVFVTDRNVRFLGECDTIFVNGTFRIAPRPYHQLLTIHGLYRGTVVPLCFSLLSGKTVGHYRQVLAHEAAK
jgi:FLYWCH zinc finger domain